MEKGRVGFNIESLDMIEKGNARVEIRVYAIFCNNIFRRIEKICIRVCIGYFTPLRACLSPLISVCTSFEYDRIEKSRNCKQFISEFIASWYLYCVHKIYRKRLKIGSIRILKNWKLEEIQRG